MSQAGAGNPGGKSIGRHAQHGQMCEEPAQITGTDPGSSPGRAAGETLTAMWDNRQTWHFAVNDYQGQRRVMHRILLAGSKPVPAA